MKTNGLMHQAWKSPARFGLTLSGIVAVSAGCVSLPEDCLDRLRCADPSPSPSSPSPPPPLAFASGGGSTAVGAGGAGAAGGGASTCVPRGDGSAVPDGCGIFVRTAGRDDNPGSRDAPVATIARAIALAAKGPKRVYACAEVFAEAISLRAAIALHGGLACDNDWAFAGGTPTTLAPPRGVPLRLFASADGVTISDLTFVAPSGATPGESSIAAIAEGVTAELLRCALRAGRGADGAQGSPALAIPWLGAVGSGDRARDGEGGRCPPGGEGEDGARGRDGAPGDGGTGLGQISAVGYRGVDGGEGRAGAPGQSGGSGNGSGGPGGPGGAGGGGGKAAGSSIALISLRAHLTLSQVTLEAGDGGRGGKGGAGGPGGAGVNAGCHGGRGGDGGKGGFGGGGAGGHSIGLAYTGLRPLIEDRAITLGKAGEGGLSAGNAGARGVVARQQGFD